MNILLAASWLWMASVSGGVLVEKPTVIVVVGAEGEAEFGEQFRDWAGNWRKAAEQAGAHLVEIGRSGPGTNDLAEVEQALRVVGSGHEALWIVLIGHGTFDGTESKFNLRGPDLSGSQLAGWLATIHRPVALVDCAAASGPFIKSLSATNRVIVVATRSGGEENFAHFGKYMAGAMTDLRADLDKDGQVSLLEAFLFAADGVRQFYSVEGRLATEHPLLDDNGDGVATPADWFKGIRATRKAANGTMLDGLRAHQFVLVRNPEEARLPLAVRVKRDELELAVGQLREKKGEMPEAAYYEKLEKLLLELARLGEAK